MSMSDPIADMLTRIRNAQMVGHAEVAMPASRLKASIAQVLKQEGYIEDFALRDSGLRKELRIGLKYYAGRPVIERLERVSKPLVTPVTMFATSARMVPDMASA